MIYWRDELRLGLLRLRGANSENDIEREYFQTQMQSDQMLTRGYIARISSQSSSAIAEVGGQRVGTSWSQLKKLI